MKVMSLSNDWVEIWINKINGKDINSEAALAKDKLRDNFYTVHRKRC